MELSRILHPFGLNEMNFQCKNDDKISSLEVNNKDNLFWGPVFIRTDQIYDKTIQKSCSLSNKINLRTAIFNKKNSYHFTNDLLDNHPYKKSLKAIQEIVHTLEEYLPDVDIAERQQLITLLVTGNIIEKYNHDNGKNMDNVDEYESICIGNGLSMILDNNTEFIFSSLWQKLFLTIGYHKDTIFSRRCSLRKGKWTKAEEHYTLLLLYGYSQRYFNIPPFVSIRKYLVQLLHSDALRISKKLNGNDKFRTAKRLATKRVKYDRLNHSQLSLFRESEAKLLKDPNVYKFQERLAIAKMEFLKSVQLEALTSLRKYIFQVMLSEYQANSKQIE